MTTFNLPYNNPHRDMLYAMANVQTGDTIIVKTEGTKIYVEKTLSDLKKTGVNVVLRDPTDAELLEPRYR